MRWRLPLLLLLPDDARGRMAVSDGFDITRYGFDDDASARQRLVNVLEDHGCCIADGWGEQFVQAVMAEQNAKLVELLRDMDATQAETEWRGEREIAWYYQRDAIEDALGLERGALDTGEYQPEDDAEDEA